MAFANGPFGVKLATRMTISREGDRVVNRTHLGQSDNHEDSCTPSRVPELRCSRGTASLSWWNVAAEAKSGHGMPCTVNDKRMALRTGVLRSRRATEAISTWLPLILALTRHDGLRLKQPRLSRGHHAANHTVLRQCPFRPERRPR